MYYGHEGAYPAYDPCCGYGYGYGSGSVGSGYGWGFAGHRNGFALIVVLFILLIIIGACWIGPN
ncbi:YjcZ family sporulation protein [Heyndrickxia faecalis]|uniref:YjcZ family sporulation protein n=1 Tax=Heyndrickxia faecalis TaxID=2824910 RepID=A0AAU7WCQ9_9BACI